MEILLENSKYNSPECLEFSIANEESLNLLIKKYHDNVFTPNFIYRILKDMPHKHRELIRIHPKMYSFGILENGEPEFILIPNSPKLNHESLMMNPKNEKNNINGLILVGYYIHPKQIADSVFSDLSDRKKLSNGDSSFLPKINEKYLRKGTEEENTILPRNNSFSTELDNIDNNKITDPEYLVTIADLKNSHIKYLTKVKNHIIRQLTEVYNVDFKTDKIELFFHFPNSIETSTLHIHVRINAPPVHKTESGTRYYLDEVIKELEKNGNLHNLILSRNPNYTDRYFNSEILKDIKGLEFKIVKNKYSFYSDKIHETSKKELDHFSDTLESFFKKEEIEYLYSYEKNYKYINITKDMLTAYLNDDIVELILQNKSFFYDLNNHRNIRGRFEKQFADKFIELIKDKKLFKKTEFIYKSISSKINNYEIFFADDKDYLSGIITCVGEISNDCESLGKHGTNYVFFDMLSEDCRRFFIKKEGKIIGQSLIFIDQKKETLVISSLACLQSIDYKVIRVLIENFSISLLKANQNIKKITLGVGGRNFVVMNCEDMPKKWPKNNLEQTETWKAWQRLRRNPNPDKNDIFLCSKSLGYPIDLESNISLRIKDEELYHMTPKERWDSYRVAIIVDRQNIIQKEKANQEQIKELNKKNLPLLISFGNNQAKHTMRQIEFMEIIQTIIRNKFKYCCPIEQTKSNNKKYSSFIINSLDEIGKIQIKEYLNDILGQAQINFHDSILFQFDDTFDKNNCLIFSIKIDSLGFHNKNIIDKLKSYL